MRGILDTDLLSLYHLGHARVRERVDEALDAGYVAISVITVEEQITSWYGLLHRSHRPADVAHAYRHLADTVTKLAEFPILEFSEASIARYRELIGMKLNAGKNDLKIAAIALQAGRMVVTRNVRDFLRVPGLVVEDWST